MVRRIKAPFDESYDFIISKLCFVLSNPTSYVKQPTNYQQPMWKKRQPFSKNTTVSNRLEHLTRDHMTNGEENIPSTIFLFW